MPENLPMGDIGLEPSPFPSGETGEAGSDCARLCAVDDEPDRLDRLIASLTPAELARLSERLRDRH